MTTVLFACVYNAGRSQMAAAWFNRLVEPSKARAVSAGTDPGPRVHPEVVTAMRKVRRRPWIVGRPLPLVMRGSMLERQSRGRNQRDLDVAIGKPRRPTPSNVEQRAR